MNRDLVEVIFKNLFVNSLIIRLPVIFNHDQKRGILYDILNSKKIYLSKDTIINPLTLSDVVSNVYKSKKLKGLIELGSRQTISLNKFAKLFNSNSIFTGKKYNLTSIDSGMNSDLKKILIEIRSIYKN